MPVSHAQTRHPGSPSIHNGTMLGKDLSYRRAVSPKTPRWIRPAFLTSCGVLAIVMSSCSSGSSPSSSTTTTQTATTTTSGSALSAAAIRTLQAALSKVGCYTGEVDGVGGPLTTAAVRSFQAAEGLAVDGVYGSSTKSRLATAVAAGTRVCASSTTTTSSAVTTTTAASAAPAAATAAINAYETANGPPVGTWQITATQVSSVDPSYILFRIGPAPGYQDTVQGGYGFVHNQSGTWTVIGFGSAQVGCPPGGAQTPVVPTAVLTGFGLACPPST